MAPASVPQKLPMPPMITASNENSSSSGPSLGATVGDASQKQVAFGFNPLGFRHPIVAPFAGILVTFIWNFVGYKYFVFKKRAPAVIVA